MPIPAAFDLSGRVAVVTGAGSPDGIGFRHRQAAYRTRCRRDDQRHHGPDPGRVSELRSAGFDAAGIIGDLTDAGVAAGLVSAALEQWGRLDIVVNNVGIRAPRRRDDWVPPPASPPSLQLQDDTMNHTRGFLTAADRNMTD
jgi:3-oxoacyl-[acyl-carrier protein] reductase